MRFFCVGFFFWWWGGSVPVSLVSAWEKVKISLLCIHKLNGYGNGLEREVKMMQGEVSRQLGQNKIQELCAADVTGVASLPALGSAVLLSLSTGRCSWKSIQRAYPCWETECTGKKK